MKFFIFIDLLVIATIASANPIDEYSTNEVSLVVPEDPNSWVFNGDNSTSGRGGKISNGWQASNTQFPWVAELAINTPRGGLLCTASLIASNWLLGARHCIADTGATSVQASLGSADRQASRVRVFANQYIWLNSNTGTNHPDIALFRLAQAVATTSTVKPVRLPAKSQAGWTYENQIITAAGWGGVAGGGFSRYLQWTQFRVQPLNVCNHGIYLCSRTTGASSLEGGDSGGPSVIYEGGVPTIVGINVYYTLSAIRYQGSTKVNLFLNFISTYTGIPLRN